MPNARTHVEIGGKMIVVSLPIPFEDRHLAKFEQLICAMPDWKDWDGPFVNGAIGITFETTIADAVLLDRVRNIYRRCFPET